MTPSNAVGTGLLALAIVVALVAVELVFGVFDLVATLLIAFFVAALFAMTRLR